MAKIKTADERIAEAKVAMQGVEQAYIDMAVAFEKLRLAIIAVGESPVVIELAEEFAKQEAREADGVLGTRPGWWIDPE